VVHDVIDPVEEGRVGGRLHLLERRHEEGRAKPGVGLAGDERLAVEVAGRGGEPPVPEVHHVAVAEEDVLSLRYVGEAVGLHHVGEGAVGLDAGPEPTPLAPCDERAEERVEHQVGEREVVVVSDVGSRRPRILPERGQKGPEVVPAALLELRQELLRPVRSVDLEAVAEDRPERRRPPVRHRVHHPVAGGSQEHLERLRAEVVEYRSFHAESRTLHLLARRLVHENVEAPLALRSRPRDDASLLARVAGALTRLVAQDEGAGEVGRLVLRDGRRDHGHEPVVAGQVRSETPLE
jgi:hypothetical protein